MKVLLLILVPIISLSSKGQNLHAKLINVKADSIVISYWGKVNFKKYIRLDQKASEYLIEDNLTELSSSTLDKPLKFSPNKFFYRYGIHHPLFKKMYYPIQFYLDISGQIVSGLSGPGLIKFENLDSFKIISKDSAIRIAQKAGLKKSKKWTTEIDWYDPVTHWSSINSKLVWVVKSYHDQPYREGCILYTFTAMYIDIKTGVLLGTEE